MNNKKGFTLIEILAVIVILGILALITVPIVTNVIENTNKSASAKILDSFVKRIETLETEYYADNDTIASYFELGLTKADKPGILGERVVIDIQGSVIYVKAHIKDYLCEYREEETTICNDLDKSKAYFLANPVDDYVFNNELYKLFKDYEISEDLWSCAFSYFSEEDREECYDQYDEIYDIVDSWPSSKRHTFVNKLDYIYSNFYNDSYEKFFEVSRESINSITFNTYNGEISDDDFDYSIDVSENLDGTVMMYVEKNRYNYIYRPELGKNTNNKSIAKMLEATPSPGYNYYDAYDIVIVSNKKVIFPTDCSYLLSYIPGNIVFNNAVDTSNVTDMSYMFFNSFSYKYYGSGGVYNQEKNNSVLVNHEPVIKNMLTDVNIYDYGIEVDLDLSCFDTSNVIYMQSMFSVDDNDESYESYLYGINLSSFNTSKVLNMSYMFYGCEELNDLDLSNFNTSDVTDMESMFSGCFNLVDLNLSNFSTSNVVYMSSMFSDCYNLSSLDLSSFNTSKVLNMSYMFSYSNKLKTIYTADNWNVGSVTNSTNMFYGCNSLVGGISYDSTKIDKRYTNYTTGYFTLKK